MPTFWKIDKLHEWSKNPRSIKEKDFERLKKQITKFGQYKPILITPDGEVIGGNMRLKAYRALGISDIWVSVVSPKTEAEKLEYALSDNDRAGYYDTDLIANLMPDYPEFNWGDYAVDLKEPQTLDDLIQSLQPIEEDEVPELSDEPAISKLGEVYQLGRHRLMCGDSTKIEDVEKLMDGQKADMVFTDPPYGLGGYGGRKDMDLIGDDEDVQKFYDCIPIVAETYIWGNAYNMANLKTKPRDVIVWKKNNFGLGSGYRGQYELIFYWGKFDGDDSDVWEINKDVDYQHPTQKPVSLAVRAINNSKPKEIVLDLFGGSGSTLIACEQTNRTCYMMELDPKYCDVIRKRYENFTKNR